MTIIGYALAWLDEDYTPPVWRIAMSAMLTATPKRAQREVDAFTRRNPGIPVRLATITIDDEEADR